MARSFLATYRPLCRTRKGQEAIQRYALQPFVDGSCRREPDFECEQPSITALCRGRMFAPRLRVGDRIAYITKKGRYGKCEFSHWRLVALLTVIERFECHDDAAVWYRERGLGTPRNCITTGSLPLDLELTDGELPKTLRPRARILSPERIVQLWDARYRARAKAYPQVLACERVFINLSSPPVIRESDWMDWIGRIPVTRTPPVIADEVWERLEDVVRSADGEQCY